MSIKFPCPHCKRSLKVKEELAGRKAKCPACQQVLTIPKPAAAPANVEELVAAALTEKPAAATAPAPPPTVDFTCFYCDAELKIDASLAGKQTPCPECKHIIKVPLLVKDQPKDWRAAETAGPTGARRDVGPAPEGAWGSTTSAGVVSRQALAEAGAIPKAPEPRSLWRMILLAGASVTVVGLLAAGGWFGWNWYVQGRQDQMMAHAAPVGFQRRGETEDRRHRGCRNTSCSR